MRNLYTWKRMMYLTEALLYLLIAFGMFASYSTKKLSAAGAVAGGLVAFGIVTSSGYPGFFMLAAFFLLAVLATSIGGKRKTDIVLEDGDPERRNASQVFANGGIASILGFAGFVFPQYRDSFNLMIAAALSSATADTLSSELGNVFGKKYYNILSFKKDTRGLDGVISLEGTLFGLVGSFIIACIYAAFNTNLNALWLITLSGTLGNVADSVLGATLERRGFMGNNMVNFANTFCGALIALILHLAIQN